MTHTEKMHTEKIHVEKIHAEKIKVMVVDDHPLMRVGVASIVNARQDMTVVAQTGTGEEAVTLYQQHKPDVTLMDLRGFRR